MNFTSKVRNRYIVMGSDTPYDLMCQEIASDDILFNHIAHYVSGDPEALSEHPEDTKKLEAILKKGPPLKAGGKGMIPKYFYRGELESQKHGYDYTRSVQSWTPNKEVALDFAKNVGGVVVRTSGPVQGVSLSDLAYWRTQVKKGESHYSSDQGEWLLLRPKNVETVYTKETGWTVTASSETLTLWHGGNLDVHQDYVAHKGGKWEHGPGLYLTTHYGTAKKYAKGSRKLYKVVVRKGVDLKDATLPLDAVKGFVDAYVIKSKRKDVLERLEKRAKDGQVVGDIFVNVMVNEEAVKNTNTDKLREFLVAKGIDYAIVDNAFGWHERMVVLFNMKNIVSKTVVKPSDEIEVFDLPVEFK